MRQDGGKGLNGYPSYRYVRLLGNLKRQIGKRGHGGKVRMFNLLLSISRIDITEFSNKKVKINIRAV